CQNTPSRRINPSLTMTHDPPTHVAVTYGPSKYVRTSIPETFPSVTGKDARPHTAGSWPHGSLRWRFPALHAAAPEPRDLQHDDQHAQNREGDDPAGDPLLQDLVEHAVRKDQAEDGVIPALQPFPARRTQAPERPVIGQRQQQDKQQSGKKAEIICRPEA